MLYDDDDDDNDDDDISLSIYPHWIDHLYLDSP